jgi:RNA polymerase sigma-70 factor (ECF subfamily)
MSHRVVDDPATVEDLLAHSDWMRDLARRLLGDRDEADDVVQEAWVNALRLPPSRTDGLRPWIATVILNLVRSRARRDARARARDHLLGGADSAPAAEEQLCRRQTERLLAELVLALEEPYRGTILRRFHDGCTSAEIARKEGVAEGTVRWRLKYALDELRRGFSRHEGGNKKVALQALIPVAGVPVAWPGVASAAQWLGQATALLPGKAILTGTSAAAALAAITLEIVTSPVPPSPAPRPRIVVASDPMSTPRLAPAALPTFVSPLLPAELPPPPASHTPTAAAGPAALAAIDGVVRDSRGEPAAHVPVTLRASSGSGAADRTTITDHAGRFRYEVVPNNRFVLTAELKGEPAARIELEAPKRSAAEPDSTSADVSAASFATINVALAVAPRKSKRIGRPRALASPLSRWCCREAFLEGEMVYGRACLRFDDTSRSEQSGCDLYGLKAQVSCHHYTQGGFSTADLSRTDRLGCDGQLL